MLRAGRSITFAGMHRRERILVDVLSIQPEEGTQALRKEHSQDHMPHAGIHLEHWNSVGAIWKAAITILVLRYLFFGRRELLPAPQSSDSPMKFAQEEQYLQGTNDYLTAGTYFDDPLSRSPSASPIQSPYAPAEPLNFDLWDARYDIHDEAFTTLTSVLATLQPDLDPITLRCVLIPVIILALVSRPDSKERAICVAYFERLDVFVQHSCKSRADSENMNYSIPWDKLDAFSEVAKMQVDPEMESMKGSAPEWNWWDMLKHIDLDLWWPVTAGLSHLESSPEFWTFKLIGGVANEESFKVWMQDTTASSSMPSA
ncbi:hypothetical protein DPSP01_009672 [Paraphaeosphaeria sporulosa]|uniref:Uncharacterized protein n=1 Tax=Paraphaeosphaeria sporulosa TaxID=1460663 RepID=A0A177CUZ7_9PLEO|nr:uncharacterized protein CC84DRAFT_1256763 [Paraphaeosphaeria sporulosa]OAG11066.1 hypothetical protein CC84DRAFT_1256763 [Paraphaeosphaeria sporulosa]